ncbi:hypothetical protein FJY94_03620 [Candidatus Kaiserbacteria bacterium]|nr:hypothetical protein [Candidatus Kaiserbacteria bacterium]
MDEKALDNLRDEEKRQEARGRTRKRKRPGRGVRCGRLRTADKIALAQRTEQVFPDGIAREQCVLSHTRPVWRLENGQAVLVPCTARWSSGLARREPVPSQRRACRSSSDIPHLHGHGLPITNIGPVVTRVWTFDRPESPWMKL